MAAPKSVPASRLKKADFVASLDESDLIYFLCNVGDGDSQLVLVPYRAPDGTRRRRAIVVDSASPRKIPDLLDSCIESGLLGPVNGDLEQGSLALVVATHPHFDHIGGIRELFARYGDVIAEFWDPGYYHTTASYHQMMAEIERRPTLLYSQPTSGHRRWIGDACITVLAPSVRLKNQFDTYGVQVNDASISLKIEFPAARVEQRDKGRNLIDAPRRLSLVLGADAQTLSWSHVLTDFPYLAGSGSDVAQVLKAATGSDPLRSHVLKIAHHASKHGVNLELVERMAPVVTLVSSVADGGSYNFPHTVAQELIREALEPTTRSNNPRTDDSELNIFYTSEEDSRGKRLGSFAVIFPRSGRIKVWRFGDEPADAIDFAATRQLELASRG